MFTSFNRIVQHFEMSITPMQILLENGTLSLIRVCSQVHCMNQNYPISKKKNRNRPTSTYLVTETVINRSNQKW